MNIKKAILGKAQCAVDLGDGSERGEYVCQDYIINKLGRPHKGIGLMYCYYPLDKGWPERASIAFQSKDSKNAWGYPYDDYFPYQGGLEGNQDGEPFTFMRDIRKHGQDVNLTMTFDCAVSDEQLIAIAKDLKKFGRIRFRINHEATGTWFNFNKRYSYQEVADFFVRFHKIIKEYAPNVSTLICIGGLKKDGSGEIEYEEEFTEALQVADIWSHDRYISLHWGWPNDIAEPGLNNHSRNDLKVVHEHNRDAFERYKVVNNGKDKLKVLSELNTDGDVTGGIQQAEDVKEFYDRIKSGEFDFYNSITMYQFRDRGRLGLEQEDPNNPDVGIDQPLLQTYKEIISDPYFNPTIKADTDIELPFKLRWGDAEDSDGIAIGIDFEKNPVFCEVTFNEEGLNLMMEINGRWFYKAPDTKVIDLMPAFWDKPLTKGKEIKLNIFAPPANGENDPSQGDDWDINYYSEMQNIPEFRIRYAPSVLRSEVNTQL